MIWKIAILFLVSIPVYSLEIKEDLLRAIAKVESSNKVYAIGDNGKALGLYQLHKVYIEDVNRFSTKKYKHTDAFDAKISREIVRQYLTKYGKQYEMKEKKKATYEVLARIHNGGPDGYKKTSTISYWKKVKNTGNFKD